MKKILILAIAAITLTATNAQAQAWLDALKGVATNAIDTVTGGQLTANALYGTWSYNQPGIKLSSSTSTLSDLTASAAASTLQTKMATYYEKVGIKAGTCSFVFNDCAIVVYIHVGECVCATFVAQKQGVALAVVACAVSILAHSYKSSI